MGVSLQYRSSFPLFGAFLFLISGTTDVIDYIGYNYNT